MDIIIENKELCLTLGEDCITKSLICKKTGEECLMQGVNLPLFSLTEDRPYNNEIKLAHPNKRTTFQANRVRREGNSLIVGFELIKFEARVEIKEADNYISFELADFIIKPEDFGHLAMTPPPVAEFRLIQLPIKNRERFGEWLNVFWDDSVAVNVLANSRWSVIDSDKFNGYRVMHATARRDVKLKKCSASLIVTPTHNLMNAIEALETDYNLPSGVKNRRRDKLNASIYWAPFIHLDNVDEHIALAKKAGFRMMLIYFTAPFYNENGYTFCGNYDYNEHYPNGEEDLKLLLQKIKAAGITPGLHILQTHIGIKSRYVTPVADHRLNLTRYFTLAKPLVKDDTVVYVEQNPEGTVMHEKCRVLKFGGELISYEGYTTERPYTFTGCKRGHFDTYVTPHEIGTIGGILDITEFGATSVYADQNTSLQDEVAEKLARAYNCGFEFMYYDGSEGTNPPFEIHVPNAQYKVYEKLDKEPIFCEGAAKAHFSWHMLCGGNAFDRFPMSVFKKKIAEFPLEEAPRMANDFTRVNFGWWGYDNETMPDIYEYGTSKAASWDCPITLQIYTERFATNPRTDDNLEVIKRWEDAREQRWFTEEQKIMLRDPDKEFTLLIDEKGDFELVEYVRIKLPDEIADDVTAYVFKRADNKAYVVTWSTKGEDKLKLNLSCDLKYEVQLGGETVPVDDGVLQVAGKRYLSGASREELVKAFETAVRYE